MDTIINRDGKLAHKEFSYSLIKNSFSMKWALYKLALASFTAFPHTVGYMTILIVIMISVFACFLMMFSFTFRSVL